MVQESRKEPIELNVPRRVKEAHLLRSQHVVATVRAVGRAAHSVARAIVRFRARKATQSTARMGRGTGHRTGGTDRS
jgi:hypothetical protein